MSFAHGRNVLAELDQFRFNIRCVEPMKLSAPNRYLEYCNSGPFVSIRDCRSARKRGKFGDVPRNPGCAIDRTGWIKAKRGADKLAPRALDQW